MASITGCHTKNRMHEWVRCCKFRWFCPLQHKCKRICDRRQYLVIGCTATLWCALKPACRNPGKCGENTFLSGHNFRTSTKGKAWGAGGGGTDFPSPVACWLRQQMDVADPSQRSQQRLKAGSQSFSWSWLPALLSRGSIHLYLLLSEACSGGPPSLTLCGAAGGLADPPVWE